MEYLYHGSWTPGIEKLFAVSKLHGAEEKRVVYLTESMTYALFYIWDAVHNKKPGKHVTCFLEDGVVHYEEQFPNQLAAFYDGVAGYMYSVRVSDKFTRMPGREAIWYSSEDVPVEETIYIPDVYEEILRREKEGKVQVIRFDEVPKELVELLYGGIEAQILAEGLLNSPQSPDAVFYKTFFPGLWERAKAKS